ncbi:hypothetical protein TSUD_53840 [Trifolium subterraneum]|uniref:Integrase catalytic domain-containing protein n=1 Tax=Trifolium subterraneum TaxID=3900 RepID=A0A2Z6NQM9_TRISU|nr:hypothetical protein TSUD_53840 [Trifolium subterraneum]
MAGANQEFMGENNPPNPPHHQPDGVEASVTPEEVPLGAPMEVVMVELDNTINRQGQLLREQADNMRGQNDLIREQNLRIRAVENSRAASKISRSIRRHRSPTPENNRSRSSSRSPRPAPRRNAERPGRIFGGRIALLHKGTTTLPHRGTTVHLLTEIIDHHRGTVKQLLVENHGHSSPTRIGKIPSLDKYDGITDPDEHIQTVETALDYRNLRGAIKCKLFPLSLIRGASTWWRNLPPGSIDSLEELCRMFTTHFTTSRWHPKIVANMKAIIQPEESLRSYIERFNKVFVEVDATDKMKLYLLEEGLREGTKFQEVTDNQGLPTILLDKIMLAVDLASPEQNVEEENRVIGGVALAISRPEDFLPFPNNEEKEALDYLAAHLDGSWENFLGALVISGGGFNPVTIGSIKRKFDELEKASPVGEIKITEVKESSVPLTFYREEVLGGSQNFQIPLLVRAKMANFDVRRILIDQGSSCDIMYSGLFKVLQLTEENLVPYVGSDLQGFNGSTTKPWGYVDLIVTFGENKAMKSVKVKFLVVNCPSLYNCIIRRPTLAEPFAVSSTIHLKLKHYTKDGQVATINGDIEAALRWFEATSKNLNFVFTPKKKKEEAKLPGVNLINTEDAVELDARTSKKERKQEKKAMKYDLLIKENYRPTPDGEFELVPLGEDPTKGIKIGADLPDLVKRKLKACLRENAEFAWSAAKMPGIDPEVACHQLTIDPRASVVVQSRRKQSPEKAEAGKKAVKDLLEANFIVETQACPKDAYPLPNIDKLVDNSSGFKLLSFMDAYSGYNQIKMAEIDKKNTSFMTETGATYQRMMNKVFHNEIGDMLEVYMDDMIVKSEDEIDHTVHLKRVFDQARKINMRFNPEKCTFVVKAGKFLGFYLTERGIEANPDKCRAFFDYLTPKSKKSIQTLNGMLTSMARFVAKSAQHTLPLFKLLRKETTFEWTEECERAALQGPELRYLQIEKIALAVIMAARKLRYYFLAHSIVIRTDQPVKQLLARPDMVGRMLKWSLELAEFDISFERSRAGIILENGHGVLIEVSLGFSFPTTNNQAEYEAFLAGLRLAEDMGAEEIKIYTDSQLVASQRLLEYLNLIKEKLAKFKETEVKHVPREHNARADVLSKLASTRRKKAGNQSVIQETLTKPSIEKAIEVMHIYAIDNQSWIAPVYNFLKSNTLPADAKEATKIRKRACSYVLLDDKLYRRGFSIPLLKSNKLKTLISPWPFAWWGMDILGPFPTASRHVKYLIVVVVYFTKWIEAEPLAKIGATHILRFFKRNVLARFGIPQVVVTDNGTQFTNKKFQEFLAAIGTTQHFTSVEHPQTNGQAEAANRVILRGLRRRIGASKGNWTEELHNVLWIEYPHEEDINDELLREELDLVEELRTGASLREATLKQKIAARHDKRVIKREFEVGSLVLRRNHKDSREGKLAANWEGPELRIGASLREATLKQKIAARHDKRVIKREFEVGSLVLRRNHKDSREGKLAANWEGPYRVRAKTENGAYHLKDLYGKEIPRNMERRKDKTIL